MLTRRPWTAAIFSPASKRWRSLFFFLDDLPTSSRVALHFLYPLDSSYFQHASYEL